MLELSQPTVIAAATLLFSIIVLVGSSLFWLGRIGNQVNQLDKRADRFDERFDRLGDRIEQVAQEMRAELRDFREEMRAEMRESRSEMQRNHEQLLAALAGHTHDEAGQAVFRNPL